MEGIIQAHEYQEKHGNLRKTIRDVQSLIDKLQNARDAAAQQTGIPAMHAAKVKLPVVEAFVKMEDDLKEINRGMNQYQKALKDKFKNAALPTAPNEALTQQPSLLNRAIVMHLLREGKFDVAKTFVREVNEGSAGMGQSGDDVHAELDKSWLEDLADGDDFIPEEMGGSDDDDDDDDDETELGRSGLQRSFSEMYHILDALRNPHPREPAIEWAKQHSAELEHRGSNLEFEISRLKFVELYTADDGADGGDTEDAFAGPLRALDYARTTFPSFSSRYARETSSLLGSLAFSPALAISPYKPLFDNDCSFEEASASFTREFCGMLGLSSQSPLYTAVTAGGIALPKLEKVERVMAQARGQWTSVNELPVETPLPPGFLFHSIFVCPVSKEQATDANPPMMLPCGHVLAKESLDMHGKGKSRIKCPYCPNECHPKDAKRVYI